MHNTRCIYYRNTSCMANRSLLRYASPTKLIGRWTESDRTADGIRSDGGRNPIGRRTVYDDNPPTSTPYTPPIKPIFIN